MDVKLDKIKSEPKYRRPLNDEQLLVLKLLYNYRFSTVELVTRYLDKTDIKVVQKKLKILEEQGLIAKHYDKSYKLQGRPAEHYLTPKGARLLLGKTDPKSKAAYKVTAQGIKSLYKNPTVSEDFITHSLNVLKVSLHFKDLYGDKLTPFTRMQMISFDYFPVWRPDLYLSLKTSAKGEPHRFFLDVWDGTRPFFVSVRKARVYITYAEEGDWPSDQAKLPVMLMLCDSEKTETKLRRQIRKALDESYEDVYFATATIEQLINTYKPSDKHWLTVSEYPDDERYNMDYIRKSLEQSD